MAETQTPQKQSGLKTDKLGPMRISPKDSLLITKRANQLFPEKIGKNISKYILHLVYEDINNNKTLDEKEKECEEAEQFFIQQQIVRIGNNLNQIAHALNIIKKRDDNNALPDGIFQEYLDVLKNISFEVGNLE